METHFSTTQQNFSLKAFIPSGSKKPILLPQPLSYVPHPVPPVSSNCLCLATLTACAELSYLLPPQGVLFLAFSLP